MHIVIHGQVPAQKNSMQMARNPKTGKYFPVSSAATRKWKTAAKNELKALLAAGDIQPIPEGSYPVSMVLVIYVKDNVRRDSDNMLSTVQDMLITAGILNDDCWQELNPRSVEVAGIDRENPRAEVYIDE